MQNEAEHIPISSLSNLNQPSSAIQFQPTRKVFSPRDVAHSSYISTPNSQSINIDLAISRPTFDFKRPSEPPLSQSDINRLLGHSSQSPRYSHNDDSDGTQWEYLDKLTHSNPNYQESLLAPPPSFTPPAFSSGSGSANPSAPPFDLDPVPIQSVGFLPLSAYDSINRQLSNPYSYSR